MLFFKLVELELQRIAKLSVRLRFQQHHQLGPWTLLVFTSFSWLLSASPSKASGMEKDREAIPANHINQGRSRPDRIYTKGLRSCRSTQGLKDNGTTYLGSDGAAAMAECAGEAATKAMAGKTIIFVRHGESEYNKARSWGRWQWHAVTVSFLQIWSDCWQQVGDLSLLAWGTLASSHVSSLQRGID